jgi:hypothetical protein
MQKTYKFIVEIDAVGAATASAILDALFSPVSGATWFNWKDATELRALCVGARKEKNVISAAPKRINLGGDATGDDDD